MAGVDSVLTAKQENHMHRHAWEGKSIYISPDVTPRDSPLPSQRSESLLHSPHLPSPRDPRVIVNDVAN